MRKSWLLSSILLLLLASCNLPSSPAATVTLAPDSVATEVSRVLTAMPSRTPTSAPAVLPTSQPSETPAPTEPPAQATDTVTAPSPTATRDPESSLGQPKWRESFDGGKAFYQYENENTRVQMRNGSLELTGLTANGWLGWSLTFSQKPQNFTLEGVFTTQTCSGADIYGIVFRAPDTDSGYFFGVTCDGRYSLHARDFVDGTDLTLINLTANSAIRSGSSQTNILAVNVSGDKIGLYANDVLMQEINDSSFTAAGNFGAFVAANNTSGFTVLLDEMSLWNLP